MKFVVAAHSDTGIKKQVNQDSLCVKVADTKKGQIAMGVICDGMGGLRKGELASATVIRAFSQWFETRLPLLVEEEDLFKKIKKEWNDLIQALSQKLQKYGSEQHISLGTTLSAILLADGKYLTVNVGDSRIYQINKSIIQITTDQTLVEKEIQANRLTREEAETDPRRSVLLQCIGSSRFVEPEFVEGQAGDQEVFFVCSDGFRHKLKSDEMLGVLSPVVLNNQRIIKESIIDLVEMVKSRGETDNISVLLIRTI